VLRPGAAILAACHDHISDAAPGYKSTTLVSKMLGKQGSSGAHKGWHGIIKGTVRRGKPGAAIILVNKGKGDLGDPAVQDVYNMSGNLIVLNDATGTQTAASHHGHECVL